MAETAMFPVDAVVREPVFVACGLSKIYRMGDVEVHALRSVDLEL